MVQDSLIPTPDNPVDITLGGVDSHAVYEIWVDGNIQKSTAMGASTDGEDTISSTPDGMMKADGAVGPNGRDSYRVTGYVRQMALAKQFWPENTSNFYVNGTELDDPYEIVVKEDALSVEITELTCSSVSIDVSPTTATVQVQADVSGMVDGSIETDTLTKGISGSTTLSPGDFGSQYQGRSFKSVRVIDGLGVERATQSQDVTACLPDPTPDPPDEPTDEPDQPSDGGGGGIGMGAAAAGLAALLLLTDDEDEK